LDLLAQQQQHLLRRPGVGLRHGEGPLVGGGRP
jgi:hypothetical protein